VLVPVRATRTASSDGSPQTCAQRQSETTDGCIFVQDDGARSCAKERTESPRGGLGIKAGLVLEPPRWHPPADLLAT
jgi:hypothetical protein